MRLFRLAVPAETGKVYDGEFEDNMIQGNGVMKWPDNSRYEGEFMGGLMEGRGIKYFANGNIHDCTWHTDKPHGQGTFYSVADGEYKQGTWTNGKLNMWQISSQKVKGKICTEINQICSY